MEQYFSRSVKNPKEATNLPKIILDAGFLYVRKKGEETTSDIVTFDVCSYRLFKETPSKSGNAEPDKIVGYLSTAKKQSRVKKLSHFSNAVLLGENDCYELHEKSGEKVIGYLKANEENAYIAVTVENKIMPLLWLIFICFLLILLFVPPIPTPVFTHGEVTNGAITPTEIGELEPDYFNIKLNATPILEDSKMNIRIENSVRNIFSCYVEVFVCDKLFYTSPTLHPDESLEFAVIEKEYSGGIYDGVAVFHYIDGNDKLEVTSNVRLKIDVRK